MQYEPGKALTRNLMLRNGCTIALEYEGLIILLQIVVDIQQVDQLVIMIQSKKLILYAKCIEPRLNTSNSLE